ncbi:MAG TPA: sigma-70 family RNA polymerase sigma factor [Polyangiales bacterium]|nr:sigma-70 family RNA polymerase sigma factor [Polyangiales bacterium]
MSFLDRRLLERAQRGDSAAFARLVSPHVDSVRRFAYSFARDWATADDLAQEALLKAFQALPSFQARSSITTWLYAVTRSVCLDHHRSRLARTARLHDSLDDALPEQQPGPEEILEQRDEAERLWQALRGLDPEFRVALVLYDIEGLSYHEIARVEQIPVGTVRSRLARARRKLEQALRAPEVVELRKRTSSGTGSDSIPSNPAEEPAP